MLWAVCVRIDVDEASPAAQVHALVEDLSPFLTALETSGVGRLNLAISGAALAALRRHGHERLIERIGALAEELRIDLLATARDGALLPLLPPQEIDRQLALNHAECEEAFPGVYVPNVLWPPELACSRKVAEAAVRQGFTDILVDELALGHPAGSFHGRRMPPMEGLPGIFLVPRKRAASEALAADALRTVGDLEVFEYAESYSEPAYHLVTFDLGSAPLPLQSLTAILGIERTARILDLHSHFRGAEAIAPVPCSQRSTREELDAGVPFATWFSPDNDLHAFQWRALNLTRALWENLDAAGYGPVPAVRQLRTAIDRLSREDWWRAASRQDANAPGIIADRAHQMEQALVGLEQLASPEALQEIRDLCFAIRSAGTWRDRLRRHETVAGSEDARHAPTIGPA